MTKESNQIVILVLPNGISRDSFAAGLKEL